MVLAEDRSVAAAPLSRVEVAPEPRKAALHVSELRKRRDRGTNVAIEVSLRPAPVRPQESVRAVKRDRQIEDGSTPESASKLGSMLSDARESMPRFRDPRRARRGPGRRKPRPRPRRVRRRSSVRGRPSQSRASGAAPRSGRRAGRADRADGEAAKRTRANYLSTDILPKCWESRCSGSEVRWRA